jgi:large subunit ribosomal protein L35e
MVKVKPYELRKLEDEALHKKLEELKGELAQLRLAKVSSGQPAKLAKIKSFRKGIARVLTVISEKRRTAARAEFEGKKFKPYDLRVKKTHAQRLRLSKEDSNRRTLRQLKKELNFPKRKFAVSS